MNKMSEKRKIYFKKTFDDDDELQIKRRIKFLDDKKNKRSQLISRRRFKLEIIEKLNQQGKNGKDIVDRAIFYYKSNIPNHFNQKQAYEWVVEGAEYFISEYYSPKQNPIIFYFNSHGSGTGETLSYRDRNSITIIQVGKEGSLTYKGIIEIGILYLLEKFGEEFINRLSYILLLYGENYIEQFSISDDSDSLDKEIYNYFQTSKKAIRQLCSIPDYNKQIVRIFGPTDEIQNLYLDLTIPNQSTIFNVNIDNPKAKYCLKSSSKPFQLNITDRNIKGVIPLGLYKFTDGHLQLHSTIKQTTLKELCIELRAMYPTQKIVLFLSACKIYYPQIIHRKQQKTHPLDLTTMFNKLQI
jgi:hypothetical protein